jgi:predicted amidohydrolase
MRIALVQMNSSSSIHHNNDTLVAAIEQAATHQVECIFLPEVCNIMQKDKNLILSQVSVEQEDTTLALLMDAAVRHRVWIHTGSLALKTHFNTHAPLANRSFLINSDGKITASYDKIHLFDVTLPDGENHRESSSYSSGSHPVVADSPFGRIGMSICYDIRFPALYNALALAGASILTIPAAFTRQTGRAHWHTLIRARAIENACFVIAAAQCGQHEDGRQTFGHSMIVGPWGDIIQEAGDEPTLLFADIDPSQCEDVRAAIPVLSHQRPLAKPSPNFLVPPHNPPSAP